MKVISHAIVLAAVCLACWQAFALERVTMQPIVNRWDRVEFKVSPELKPLAERLKLLEEVSTTPTEELRAPLDDSSPAELPPKDPVSREHYAVVSDARVEVERPDSWVPGYRPRSNYSWGNAKSLYWRPAGTRT
jgi:hypothetical protein